MSEPTDNTNKVDTAKAVSPKAKATEESTPLFDETVKAIETAKHFDKTDVPAALERETQDGKGDEDPGPSDWNGFATEGVEEEVK